MADKPPLIGAWSGSHDPFLYQSYLQNCWSKSHQILYADRIYQMLALGWQITPSWAWSQSCDPFLGWLFDRSRFKKPVSNVRLSIRVQAGFLIFALLFVSRYFDVGWNIVLKRRPSVLYGANLFQFLRHPIFPNHIFVVKETKTLNDTEVY